MFSDALSLIIEDDRRNHVFIGQIFNEHVDSFAYLLPSAAGHRTAAVDSEHHEVVVSADS